MSLYSENHFAQRLVFKTDSLQTLFIEILLVALHFGGYLMLIDFYTMKILEDFFFFQGEACQRKGSILLFKKKKVFFEKNRFFAKSAKHNLLFVNSIC
jgi:hypothetical protein